MNEALVPRPLQRFFAHEGAGRRGHRSSSVPMSLTSSIGMSEYRKVRKSDKMGHYSETGKLGKKGVFTIPSALRKRFGLHDGSLVIAEERDDGILLRPATATALEMYDEKRVAEFLLSNAVDAADYKTAREEVRALGLDPDTVLHRKPA
jgi:AbrB family looped-hinge helix DNA binding protein